MRIRYVCTKCGQENVVDLNNGMQNNIWPTGAISSHPESGKWNMGGFIAGGMFDGVGKQVKVQCKNCNETNILET